MGGDDPNTREMGHSRGRGSHSDKSSRLSSGASAGEDGGGGCSSREGSGGAA